MRSVLPDQEVLIVQIRPLVTLLALVALPRVLAAQFTTFIPPRDKVADSVKAVVEKAEQARADTAASVRLANMKAWVDSAASAPPRRGVDTLPPVVPRTEPPAGDTLPSAPGRLPHLTDTTFSNGARAPDTASLLPLLVVAGAAMIAIGWLLTKPPAVRDGA